MRNQIENLFFGKNQAATILILLAAFAFVGLACRGGRSADSKPIPPAYLGDWEGQDGSTLSIRSDGKGDYRAGSTKIEGGTAEVDEAGRKVSVTFFGFGKTLKIDEPPAGDQMKLDGVTFRRKGGFSTASTSNSGADTTREPVSTSSPTFSGDNDSSGGQVPSNSEVEAMVKDTIADFADAVEREDFSDFHAKSSREFQSSYAPAQLKTVFQTYIDNKKIVMPVLNSVEDTSANFSDGPRVRDERGLKILLANGNFQTKTRNAQFETEYKLENGDWKLLKFKIRM